MGSDGPAFADQSFREVVPRSIVCRMSTEKVLGVFGGAFDPPHLGHVLLPGWLHARGWIDRLLVAPCADHPFGKRMHAFDDRLAWTREAMSIWPSWVEVTDLEHELARTMGSPSYTIRLLEHVAQRWPGWRVRLVVGSDIVASGDTKGWERWPEIEQRFTPLVVPRMGYAEPDDCALPQVSSSDVRRWIEEDSDDARDKLASHVPAKVLAAMRSERGPTMWLVGQGHVAAHAKPWLRAQGWHVIEVGARALVAGAALPQTKPRAVWIVVRDPAIPDVAAALVKGGLPRDVPVLHGAGAKRAQDVLAALAAAGHPIGSLHPAVAMRRERIDPTALERATFGIEGDAAAQAIARAWVGHAPVSELDGLSAEDRVAYHAACALVANHLAPIDRAAAETWDRLGIPEAVHEVTRATLWASAAANLRALGVPAGITGPAVRGDRATIELHARALGGEAGELYRELSGRLLALLERVR